MCQSRRIRPNRSRWDPERKAAMNPTTRGNGAWRLLGPAFVASLAYVDPGNVAANLTAGAEFGYRLVWVLVLSSALAVILQYRSAKLGIVTGRTLPQHVHAALAGRPLGRTLSWGYGIQAFVIAVATDVAEVVGGALALNLLLGLPLWLGGVLVGGASLLLLWALRIRGERGFEAAITAMLGLVLVGFLGSLIFARPDLAQAAAGVVPALPPGSLLLVAAMLGATVMPHAIYLHSSLAIDRHRAGGEPAQAIPRLLRIQRADVALALVFAGTANVAMLLLAAATLSPGAGDAVTATSAALLDRFGEAAALIFALGLLASGVGSAVVGTHAGSRIARDLLPKPIPPLARRAATVVPAVALLLADYPPTSVLVASQVVLSFGIAFAAVPLVVLTASRKVMGEFVDRPATRAVNLAAVLTVVALNLTLLAQAASL